jgi:hypothetical protein
MNERKKVERKLWGYILIFQSATKLADLPRAAVYISSPGAPFTNGICWHYTTVTCNNLWLPGARRVKAARARVIIHVPHLILILTPLETPQPATLCPLYPVPVAKA